MTHSPWQMHEGMWFKREDLYKPYGDAHVNGTKVRQYQSLLHEKALYINAYHDGKLVVQQSVHSTSGVICAAIARRINPSWKVTIVVGGLKEHQIDNHPMLRLAKYYGAEIRIVCGTGMSGPVMARLREICAKEKSFNACFEDWIRHEPGLIIDPVAEQVRYIPPSVKNIYVPVGSGTQMAGIIEGLNDIGRDDVHVIGINVGPQRNIVSMLRFNNEVRYTQHPVDSRWSQYSKPCYVSVDGIGALDTCYEAKAFEWMDTRHLRNESNALWLVGRKLSASEVDALYDSSITSSSPH